MIPTMTDFNIALKSSASDWAENNRFSPEIGSNFLKSTFNDLVLNNIPPSSKGADSATNTAPNKIGINADTA
ncbi:hypothetical protein KKH3_25660 [Pectobacterium actinidiae]|nr:hypothetical protein KKH3_25660 [Pectobacterium actinidiae]